MINFTFYYRYLLRSTLYSIFLSVTFQFGHQCLPDCNTAGLLLCLYCVRGPKFSTGNCIYRYYLISKVQIWMEKLLCICKLILFVKRKWKIWYTFLRILCVWYNVHIKNVDQGYSSTYIYDYTLDLEERGI